MSGITYEEFQSELQECAVAIDQTSQNLAAANKEYERTKAEFFEKQDTATPQERYDLGQHMHAARKEADGCRAAQASALEEFSQLVQAHPEYAKQTSEELGDGAAKPTEAATGGIGKHVIAIAMVLTAALQEPAVMIHEIEESMEAHRAGVERQVPVAQEAQQSPAAQEHSGAATPADHERDTGSQHHKPPHHEHLVWPELQPDMPEDAEDDEHRLGHEPAADDSVGPAVAANETNPQPPDRPQAAAAPPPQAVIESPQAARPPVHLEVVPPPPPPPPPAEPEADRARSR